MKINSLFRVLSFVCLLCAQPGCSSAQSAQRETDRAADAAAIRAHIESICQAFVDKDRKKLEETHAKNWRGFTPWSGHVIRGLDGYMNEAAFEPGTPKGQGMVGWKISDFDVVFYGETAVASFVIDIDRVFGTDKSTQRLTILDTYHKESGGWIQVASNTSLHPDALEQEMARSRQLDEDERAEVLKAREAVWRAWFAGDTATLTRLVPPELITIDQDTDKFGTRASNLDGSRGFAASGGKLTRLAFPKTEFQAYGATVILYTTYEYELSVGGKAQSERGAATEVFLKQNGQWINTGWQLAKLN